MNDYNENLIIRVFDEQKLTSDSEIGFCCIKFSSFIINAENEEQSDWYSIFHNNERAGLLRISSKFDGAIET